MFQTSLIRTLHVDSIGSKRSKKRDFCFFVACRSFMMWYTSWTGSGNYNTSNAKNCDEKLMTVNFIKCFTKLIINPKYNCWSNRTGRKLTRRNPACFRLQPNKCQVWGCDTALPNQGHHTSRGVVTDGYEAMVEWWPVGEKELNSEKILQHCHYIHYKSHSHPGLNLRPHGEKTASNCLSYSMIQTVINIHCRFLYIPSV